MEVSGRIALHGGNSIDNMGCNGGLEDEFARNLTKMPQNGDTTF